MPAKTDLGTLNCSLARALGIVGDGWSLLILRDAFLGRSRFGEFQASLGVAKNILADRLERLVAGGVLERQGVAARPLYQLTARGQDLLPALIALMQWGDKWLSEDGPPMLLADADGRKVLPVEARTGAGVLAPAALRVRPGKGANARTRAFLDERSAVASVKAGR